MSEERDYYDEIMKIMQVATNAFWEAEIPKHQIPSVLADYLVISIIGMTQHEDEEITEAAVLGIIDRMKDLLNRWRMGEEGFEDRKWKLN